MPNELEKVAAARRPRDVRVSNTGVILELIRSAGQTTRSALIRESGLSKATVSGIVADLLTAGFVKDTGTVQEGLGRSRVVLEFNPHARTVLGAQVEDDVCRMVATDLNGDIYQRASRPVWGTEPEVIVDVLVDLAKEMRVRPGSAVVGLGVGVPGLVDRTGRVVSTAVSHGWSNVAIADMLEERLDLPVMAANRARVAALGEIRKPENASARDLIYVFLGTGIISGVVVDGALCVGRHGAAGDLGHVTAIPDGPLCGCGNHGCLHTLAAEDAILSRARANARLAGPTCLLYELTNGRLATLTLATLGEAASRQDATALSTLRTAGIQIGIAVANLVKILDPDVVALGGPIARLGDPLVSAICDQVRQRGTAEADSGLRINVSTSEDAGSVGAAALWLRHPASTQLLQPDPDDSAAEFETDKVGS